MLEFHFHQTDQWYDLYRWGDVQEGTAHDQQELERFCNDFNISFEGVEGLISIDFPRRVSLLVRSGDRLTSTQISTLQGMEIRSHEIIDGLMRGNYVFDKDLSVDNRQLTFHIAYRGEGYAQFLETMKPILRFNELYSMQCEESKGDTKITIKKDPAWLKAK
ncbi:hypothetical protein HYU14_04560 [Candidatus Woesearchaeota archaeon]|nr:hypothetical protein [Candidatus Woesearchaeota archaeon]